MALDEKALKTADQYDEDQKTKHHDMLKSILIYNQKHSHKDDNDNELLPYAETRNRKRIERISKDTLANNDDEKWAKDRNKYCNDKTWEKYQNKYQKSITDNDIGERRIVTTSVQKALIKAKPFKSEEIPKSKCQRDHDPEHVNLINNAANIITTYLSQMDIIKRIIHRWTEDKITSTVNNYTELFILTATICFSPMEIKYSDRSEWKFFSNYNELNPFIHKYAPNIRIPDNVLSIPKDMIFSSHQQDIMERLLERCFVLKVSGDETSFHGFAHNDVFDKCSGVLRGNLLRVLFIKKIIYSLSNYELFKQSIIYLRNIIYHIRNIIVVLKYQKTMFPEVLSALTSLYQFIHDPQCHSISLNVYSTIIY